MSRLEASGDCKVFADYADRDGGQPWRNSGTAANEAAATSGRGPAGRASRSDHRGAGSWNYYMDWGLAPKSAAGQPPERLTETMLSYGPPPAGHERARPTISRFGSNGAPFDRAPALDPADYASQTRRDFDGARLAGLGAPPRGQKPVNPSPIIDAKVAYNAPFCSTHRDSLRPSDAAVRAEAAALRPAGVPRGATGATAYNILNGKWN